MIELAPAHKTGLVIARPVLTAAGTWGFADEYAKLIDFSQLGAFVTNPLTWSPRQPANANGAAQTSAGVLLHTGLPNMGVRNALKRLGGKWKRLPCPVIPHLALDHPDHAWRATELLAQHPNIVGIELGFRHDMHPSDAAEIIEAAVDGELPVLVRLPYHDSRQLAQVAERAGAVAVTACAPERYTAEDADTKLPSGRLYSTAHGTHVSNLLDTLMNSISLPILASGGIASVEQAKALLTTGATAIQLDGLVWQHPQRVRDILAVG